MSSSSATTPKRVFIAFAIEDERQRDFLVGQAKNEKSPFDFIDMSVKDPYTEEWKKKCRIRIKGCNGVIALISKNSASSSGEKWEMTCATEEDVKMIGLYAYKDDWSAAPKELGGRAVMVWTWDNIKKFLNSL